MKRVSILGLGAMGSRMAVTLKEAGHDVCVWNRTRQRAEAILDSGVTIAESPRHAAANADFVISMVRDDEASKAVWLDDQTGALQALNEESIALECSTLSVPYVRELASAFDASGRTLIDAPLAGSRPQAEAGQLIFFVGGSKGAFDRAATILEPMASAVHYAGNIGSGATVKLMVNALFGAQLGAMAELIRFAEKAGIDPNLAVEIVGSTPVCSAAAKVAAGAMLSRTWTPAFPIDLVAKDFSLLEYSAHVYSADVPLSRRTGEIYARGVNEGFGGDNITGVIQLYEGQAA